MDTEMKGTPAGDGIQQPPGYFASQQGPYAPLNPAPSARPTEIVVTGPVVITNNQGSGPSTTCALVFATLSTLFCNLICGLPAICLAWKARMHALDNKPKHAAHTLTVAWIFIGLAICAGLAVYIGITILFIQLALYSK